MDIEDIPEGAKPSVVIPRASADDVHTRNIRAIAEVTRQLRDDVTELSRQKALDMQRITALETEVQQLKVQAIMAQHAGSGATAP